MRFIDIIMFFIIIFTLIYGKIIGLTLKTNKLSGYLFSKNLVIWVIILLIGTLALSSRGFSSGDDYNFWAVDVKTIFLRDGFSPKYAECVQGYGDYPPIIQIAQCYLLHIFGCGIRPGMTMSALFVTYIIYLSPLFVNGVNKYYALYIVPIVFTLGTWGPLFFDNRSPDTMMATIYGCVLCMIYEASTYDKDNKLFLLLISIVLSVLALTKSIGIQWCLFAVAFYFVLQGIRRIYILLLPMLMTYGSWMIFCKFMDRRAYLTDTIFQTVTSEQIQLQRRELTCFFMKALFFPLHSEGLLCSISVSFLGCILLYSLLVFILKRKFDIMHGKQIYKFILISGVIEILILLYSVRNMFVYEYDSFIQEQGMLSALQRYGAPITLGGVILILFLIQKEVMKESYRGGTKRICICLMVFSILLSPLRIIYETYIGYHFDSQNYAELDLDKYYGLSEKDYNKIKCYIPLVEQINRQVTNYDEPVVLFVISEGNDIYNIRKLEYICAPIPLRFEFVDEIDDNVVKKKLEKYHANSFLIYDIQERVEYIQTGKYEYSTLYDYDVYNGR